jgi:hypothetical protein
MIAGAGGRGPIEMKKTVPAAGARAKKKKQHAVFPHLIN